MDKIKGKKGNINDMVPFVLAFIVVVIVVALGGSILGTFQSTQVANSAAANVTAQGLLGISTFGSYLPVIAIVLVIAVIVGILLTYLYSKFAT